MVLLTSPSEICVSYSCQTYVGFCYGSAYNCAQTLVNIFKSHYIIIAKLHHFVKNYFSVLKVDITTLSHEIKRSRYSFSFSKYPRHVDSKP